MTTAKKKATNPSNHPRYKSIVNGVPINKYNFSEHLRKVGDYVVTYPMEAADRKKIADAAMFWAYKHRCKVRCTKEYGAGGFCVRIEVVKANTR